MSDANVIRELTESAQAMGAIAGNEDRFRAVVDAFRAKDADTNLGSVSLTMDGPGAPIGGYAFTLTPDGASSSVDFFGTASPNGFVVKKLKPCAYLVTLTVNVSLTNGDNNAGSLTDQIAFCKK